ncbi:MAG TPA: hypothetical protein VMU68_02165 [Acidimicrobiales bacterium]|nr:hypothetical protein [Acidimicrobiales bacterium]
MHERLQGDELPRLPVLARRMSARAAAKLREEVAALESDEDDLREMIEIAAFMESPRAEA